MLLVYEIVIGLTEAMDTSCGMSVSDHPEKFCLMATSEPKTPSQPVAKDSLGVRFERTSACSEGS